MTDQNEKENLSQLNRREFVIKTALTTGYALAVMPIAHSAISTNLSGIEEKDVMIPVGKDNIPAYQVIPTGNGPFPVLAICHEIFGLHEHIRDVCRRFAKEGFFVIAPSLYYRQGDVTKLKDIPEIMTKVVSKVTTKQVNGDIDATFAFIKANKKANMSKTNIVGFCWGGKTVWLYASHNPKIKTGIAFYGPLVGTSPVQPQAAVDIASSLTVPVLGLYGGKDKYITWDHIAQMEKILEKGKSSSKIIVYPDADHGFFADYRESYNKKAATEALEQMTIWIRKHNGL
ncbi:dienelactone hydrolase family protein [Fluviispira multicolorata]|uniref:Carboxymethylenebutenolidase n=1 Tax=Fluviispira multicolorata TaxID=2654512 RepID=A0A833JES7_9BACT|nr:dienelactone hydrolase family protein [Fluviispira multicolorata]KAB8033374.1 carboxymethylenebutenolidase [Fluviispira multicolorata]